MSKYKSTAELERVFYSESQLAQLRNKAYVKEINDLVSQTKAKESKSSLDHFRYVRNNYWGLVKNTYPYWQQHF